MPKRSRSKRRLPKVLTYPILGVILSFSAPIGWLLLRLIFYIEPPSLNQALPDILMEFQEHWFLYAYMHAGAIFTLTICGFAVGWRDDRIREHYNGLLSQRRLLSIKNKQLARLSVTDSLTGLANRLRLHEVLALEYKRALRYNLELCVLITDLDHFKRINDRFGHLYGDFVLHEMGQIFASTRRETDYVARTGGEEFCFVLTQTNIGDAIHFAERIRETVAKYEFEYQSTRAPVRVSIGVASIHDIPREERDEKGLRLLTLADEALYEAKRKGRNTVVQYQPNPLHVSATG